jgi:WD40 repeat protein
MPVKADQAAIFKLPSTVLGMDVSQDGSRLYAACMDGGVYEGDAKTGDAKKLYAHASFASGVSALHDSSIIISAGYDGTLIWFDVAEKKEVRRVPAHKFWSWQSDLSRDGKYFASVTGQYLVGGLDYEPAPETEPSVKVFESETGKLVHELSHVPSVQAIAFSPDGQYLAAGNLMGETRVWELSSGKQLAACKTTSLTSWGIIKVHAYQGGVYSLVFSPDSQSILVCGMGQMRDPNTGNGKQTWQRFDWRKPDAPMISEIRAGDAGGGHPEALAYHPSGKYFLMSGRLAQGKWNAGFFDESSGDLIHSLDTKARLTRIRFNSDGSKLFLAGGVGQPKAKDGNYPPFGRVFVYDIA